MCWGCKHRCCFLSSLLRSLEVIACCPLKNVQILADQELLSCQRGQQKCWMCNFILYTLPLEVYRVFWNPWNRADEPNWSTLIYIFFTIFFDAIFSCILKSLQSSFNSECVPLDFFFSLIVRFLRGAVGLKKKKKACAAASPVKPEDIWCDPWKNDRMLYAPSHTVFIHILCAPGLRGSSLHEPTCQQLQSAKTTFGGLRNAEVTFRVPWDVLRAT